MRRISLMALISGAFIFGACNKDKDDNPEPPVNQDVKEQVIDASSGQEWKYFSFSTGKELTVEDAENNLQWDIAFNRYYVKLNGGASGKGKAEAVKTSSKDFATVTQAPESGYAKDEAGEMQIGMPPKTVQASFSKVISGGMKTEDGYVSYDPAKMQAGGTNPYTVNKWVYVIKIADGTYAKVQFVDYLNEKNKGGYPKFKYQHSANGKF